MTQLFLTVINMSITATVVAGVLLIIRLLFSKYVPPVFCYLLWSVVFFRLYIPVSPAFQWSLFNMLAPLSEKAQPATYTVMMDYTELTQGTQLISPGFWNAENTRLIATIWITVTIMLLLFSLAAYALTDFRMKQAVPVQLGNILPDCQKATGTSKQDIRVYQSQVFDTPVVMGILRPRIILPSRMDLGKEKQLMHILTHELIHIRRGDHITRFITTLACMIHWFNPIVWLCYRLCAKDIEASCDERALFVLGEQHKKGYAQSLIDLASSQHVSIPVKLAFSETHLESRIKGVAKYKRLTRMQITFLIGFVFLIGIVTATNPIIKLNEYIPHSEPASPQATADVHSSALQLTLALSNSDISMLAELSQTNEPYYLPFYSWVTQSRLTVKSCTAYMQSEQLAYVYLNVSSGSENSVLAAGDNKLVAVFERTALDGSPVLRTLQPQQWFDNHMLVEKTEPVQLIENLHSFDIYPGDMSLHDIPRSMIAAFCINEEYLDRTKSGELSPKDAYIKPEWLAYSAKRYFGIENFSYTFDESMYDAAKDRYIYDSERRMQARSSVVMVTEEAGFATVTAQIYKDPLNMILDKTVQYKLKKDRG